MYFSIFKNNRKQKENHPDYNILADGYKGAGWIKTAKNGKKYISCKLEKEKQEEKKEPGFPDFDEKDVDEEVPF
jgi:uncharacterized protein (DUF736 family)